MLKMREKKGINIRHFSPKEAADYGALHSVEMMTIMQEKLKDAVALSEAVRGINPEGGQVSRELANKIYSEMRKFNDGIYTR